MHLAKLLTLYPAAKRWKYKAKRRIRKFETLPNIYFHENQFTYPWSPNDPDVELQRDKHYGFINYSSTLCADHIYFNSKFHLDSFFIGLEKFLKQLPD